MTKNQKIARLKNLSAEQLDEFCIYWNSGPVHDGSRQKAKGIKICKDQDYQKGFYRQYLLSDGWAVYIHRHDDLLILSENDTVRLKGSAKEIVGLLYNIVLTDQALQKIPEREYGLVLSGGGAKGAFEIGVWRWLERTGLIRKIKGISGTSVGALNSILFSCTDLEEAEEIWRSIRQDDLTHVNRESLKRAAQAVLKTMTLTALNPASLSMIVKDWLPLVGETFFTQKKLNEIADRVESCFPVLQGRACRSRRNLR